MPDDPVTTPDPAPNPDAPPAEVVIPENWKETLSEDMRADPVISRFNTVPDMAKALVSAQKMVGADKIAIPASDDTEAWEGVYGRLGRPDGPDKYQLSTPENMPEGFSVDDDMVSGFRETSHKLGLSDKQAAGLYKWFMEAEGGRHAGVAADLKAVETENEATMRREWGAAYDQNIAQATGAAKALLGDDAVKEITEKGYGTDPFMMRLLHKVGEKIGEAGVDGGDGGTFHHSPDQARQEIARLQTDPDFMKAYQDRAHPSHGESVRRMSRLYQEAYPEQSSSAA